MAPLFHAVMPAFVALHAAVYANFALLARPRMRPLPYRLLVSWPASFFFAGTLLALPWALARAAGLHPFAPWLPYALGAVGLLQSLTAREEEIDLVIGGPEHAPAVSPHPRGDARVARPLRIVQITDPHIGPFMSVERLRRIAARAVARNPDLIVLTGDFLTMESQSDPELLRRALEPLGAMAGKVFACHGNHDLEAPETVARALAANRIELLVDESRDVSTEAGPRADRRDGLRMARPAEPPAARLRRASAQAGGHAHHPTARPRRVPAPAATSCSPATPTAGKWGSSAWACRGRSSASSGSDIPDHGFWARGRDRMYVHRGTGHYGFPLRLGVPSEESVVRVHRLPST